jgi:2-polyprenyl-3-methyl-5-hydroxy-6-metoxy-1,4-benzoquinol methylase
MDIHNYKIKPQTYFTGTRNDVLQFLKKGDLKVLEIGCGSGATLSMLKSLGYATLVHGVELVDDIANLSDKSIDRMYVGDISNDMSFLTNDFYDVILCLDVLEHLSDPNQVVLDLSQKLKSDGSFIVSVPNIRNIKILFNLIFLGRFRYEKYGLMDKTHLKWFTRSSAIELLKNDYLQFIKCKITNMTLLSKSGILNLITLGLFKNFLATQYLVVAKKN